MSAADIFRSHLQAWAQAQRPAPLLLTGNQAAEIERALQDIKLGFVCTADVKPCKKCRACRRALSGQHPDIVTLPMGEKGYKIRDVRQAMSALATTSFSGRRLVVVVEAEKMAADVANTLLKELEDSTATNRWVLTTAYRRKLLPTVISRCQLLRVPEIHHDPPAALNRQELIKLAAQDDRGLSAATLDNIANYLMSCSRRGLHTPEITRALLRLRDYYKIKSLKGNTKMAGDVLLASLRQLPNNLN